MVIPSFDVSPHYGDRACCCTGAMQYNTMQCNAMHYGDKTCCSGVHCAVQCLPVIEQSAKCSAVQFSSTHPTSSHALTHSIVNPLMSTHPNLLFAPHSAMHRCAQNTNPQKHKQTKHTTMKYKHTNTKCVFVVRVQ